MNWTGENPREPGEQDKPRLIDMEEALEVFGPLTPKFIPAEYAQHLLNLIKTFPKPVNRGVTWEEGWEQRLQAVEFIFDLFTINDEAGDK